jgi:hypothetical protein
MNTSMLLAGAAVAAAAVSACAEDHPPPVVWEGAHLAYRTDEDPSALCGGTFEYLDGVVGYLATRFGDSEAFVDYSWVPDGPDPYCPEGTYGCAKLRRAYSVFPVHQHEVVHAVRGGTDARRSSQRLAYQPLEEAIAELYGDDWPIGGEPALATRALLEARDLDSVEYVAAGHFASYLRATFGEAALLQLGDVSRFDDDEDAFLSDFVAVFGVSLDDALESYTAEYPVCDKSSYRDDGFECSGDATALPTTLGERVDLDRSLSCDDPHVIGPRLGGRWTTVVVDVPEDRGYAIVVGALDDRNATDFRMRRCGSTCLDDLGRVGEETSVIGGDWYCLAAGRYTVRLGMPDGRDSDYRLSFEAVADVASCDPG